MPPFLRVNIWRRTTQQTSHCFKKKSLLCFAPFQMVTISLGQEVEVSEFVGRHTYCTYKHTHTHTKSFERCNLMKNVQAEIINTPPEHPPREGLSHSSLMTVADWMIIVTPPTPMALLHISLLFFRLSAEGVLRGRGWGGPQ